MYLTLPRPETVLFVFGVALVGIAFLSALLRIYLFCPHCHRRRVAGQEVCPFCHMPYKGKPNPRISQRQPAPDVSQRSQRSSVSLSPRLVCIGGPFKGNEFPLDSNGATLGRAPDNGIVIEGVLVSRYHAQVVKRDGQYFLVDRNSTNGTRVNGHRIVDQALQRGDRIEIGNAVFVFQVGVPVEPVRQVSSTPEVQAAPSFVSSIARGYESYHITGTIGSGGAATVYKGVSSIDQSTVAIKVLHAKDPFIRQKFREEGELGLALQHPHIARVYHYGESNGDYYIVMEYVDGGSLRQRLIPNKPCALDFIRLVIGQTCEALAFSHNHNVIHRDVKPENILLAAHGGGVKVADFGIAKLGTTSTKTSEGILVGTPYYIPYEQASGDEVSAASDIYSLGIVLYEMLTGQWPFTGEAIAVLKKHLTENPVLPRQINPAIPSDIETVVMRTLEKDARRRYQNALDLARDLGYKPWEQLNVSPVNTLTTLPPQTVGPSYPIKPRQNTPPPRGGQARLVVIVDNVRSKEIPLTSELLALGRAEINVNDVVISRQHLRVIYQDGQFWVEDANSVNGTFVNGRRISARTVLQPGDVIQAGRTMLRMVI